MDDNERGQDGSLAPRRRREKRFPVSLTVLVSLETKAHLEAEADASGRTLGAVAREALDAGLEGMISRRDDGG